MPVLRGKFRAVLCVKSLLRRSVCTCYVTAEVISQWQSESGEHKSHTLTLIYDVSLQSRLGFFSHTHAPTYMKPTHTDGLSHTAAWGCRIGFKNTHNICKTLRLIILVLRRNHAIWAWAMAQPEPYGKGKADDASAVLMKVFSPTAVLTFIWPYLTFLFI